MHKSKGPRKGGRRLCYAAIRERIETGDLLLFKGKGPVSAFIRWGSNSDYSHAAIASWEGERLMIFQAAGRGINHVRASEAVHKYDGQVDWWSLRPKYHDQVNRAGVIEEARKHVGKPFAVWGLIKLVVLMFVGRYKGTKDLDKPPPAMFCSWYVAEAFRVGGKLDIVPIAADHCTSPGMLERSKMLMIRGVLHDDPQGKLTDEPAEHDPDESAEPSAAA